VISLDALPVRKSRPWNRHPTPYSRIVSSTSDGHGTPSSPYLVDWAPAVDGEEDKENPMKFGEIYKWLVVLLAASSTLGVSAASSMLSAAIFDIHADFPGSSTETYIMGQSSPVSSLISDLSLTRPPPHAIVTSGFVLGFVLGPFVWAPMAEIYGNRTVFLYTYAAFTLFNGLVCASPNVAAIIVFRWVVVVLALPGWLAGREG
jgi:hypothetical protein